jgi:ribosomal protein S18 acetylase RimI-like enzyme
MTDDDVRVRRYRPSDRAAVMALAPRLMIGVAAWRDRAAVHRAVTGWVRDSVDAHDADGRAVFVAEHDSDVVGVVTVASRRHFAGEVDAYVGELVVSEGAQRRGVGTQLMREAESWAGARGFRHLTLETGAANEAARSFYQSRGYREEDIRLTKSLTAA